MTTATTATLDLLPSCCRATFARVRRTGRPALCACGDLCVSDDSPTPPLSRPATVPEARPLDEPVRHPSSPGAQPDGRISAVHDVAPPSRSPSAQAPRVHHAEDAFAVKLRRLVVELRAVELDGAGAAAIVYRERVQTSGSSYDGPRPGAATIRRPVTDRLAALATAHPREVAVLTWLRAWAPAYELACGGKVSLVLVQCARVLGSEAQHIAWTLAPKGAEVWARAAMERAMGAWWGTVGVVAAEGAGR